MPFGEISDKPTYAQICWSAAVVGCEVSSWQDNGYQFGQLGL